MHVVKWPNILLKFWSMFGHFTTLCVKGLTCKLKINLWGLSNFWINFKLVVIPSEILLLIKGFVYKLKSPNPWNIYLFKVYISKKVWNKNINMFKVNHKNTCEQWTIKTRGNREIISGIPSWKNYLVRTTTPSFSLFYNNALWGN